MTLKTPIRLAHFSDVHFSAKKLGWTRQDLITKRVTGWMNIALLGRGFRFRHARSVAAALVTDWRQRRPDHLVFSGDATSMAFESEFAVAAKALEVGAPDLPPGIAVPGNHDCYVRKPVLHQTFERYFEPWQRGERIDGETYPFAQRVGPLWLIGVNSSTCNFWTWDASGGVGTAQIERLRRLLKGLAPGPRILVTHYPFAVRSGRQERRSHRLRDWSETAKVAAEGGVGLWLHGHRHRPYLLTQHRTVPFPAVCGGSTTQTGIWCYHEYLIQGKKVQALRRVYDKKTQTFHDGIAFDFEMT